MIVVMVEKAESGALLASLRSVMVPLSLHTNTHTNYIQVAFLLGYFRDCGDQRSYVYLF